MIQIIISQHLMGKTEWSRSMIESCLRTLERRCTFANSSPAVCRVRVSRGYGEGHSRCSHLPREVLVHLELSIPGRRKPYFAHYSAEHARSAVCGAAEAIEKMLRRETEKYKTARRSWTRSRRSVADFDPPDMEVLETFDQVA